MKALTLTQPWATLVAIGAKRIETRSWSTNYSGPLAIHAAKKFPKDAQYLCFKQPFRKFLIDQYSFIAGGEIYFGKHKFPLGCVIATCKLVGCFEISLFDEWVSTGSLAIQGEVHNLIIPPGEPELSFGDYTPGRYAWILENVKMLPHPIPAWGALSFLWEWSPETEAA